MLSSFLSKRIKLAKDLVNELSKHFSYVSILGNDIKAKSISCDRNVQSISDGRDTEVGFVVKMNNNKAFFEYSLDDLSENTKEEASRILKAISIDERFKSKTIEVKDIEEEKLERDFIRESDLDKYSDEELLNFSINLKNDVLKLDNHLLNVAVTIYTQDISKIFVSKNKTLTQNYTWVNGYLRAIYKSNSGKVVSGREGSYSNKLSDVIKDLPLHKQALIDKCYHLSIAHPIEPGVYDVICDPTISGLIAHEAFGHGVEMDQFVKDRALAKKYVNDYVASKIVNMKDGAASAFSVASYFFDDDGILAHDTQIIKNGILVSGICDLVSSLQLNFTPTGNGRRESYKRKAYTRMTNTFFEKGNDKLSDMIKSIKHGYMLFETNNGMEDPKNWAIQCVCEYGIEIVDGKLTDNYVSPVVMSGYVPDLLKSISMVSDDFKIIGSGSCGKGYKEWVRVSDGGPALKARVKLA